MFVEKPAFRILIADCHKAETEIIKASFNQNNLHVQDTYLKSGEELLDFLNARKLKHPDLPQLILLDIAVAEKNSFEILKTLKQDLLFRKIPIILFASIVSNNIQMAYELGANCCVIKPSTEEEWSRTIGELGRFWMHCATLSPV